MRVLMTGNWGFLGSVFMPEFQKAGFEVVGLDTGFFEPCTLVPDKVRVLTIRKDIRDLASSDVEGFDAIGRRHALVENKGSAVMVFFWSQHMANFPEFAQGLNRMQLGNKDKKFKIIGVTLDDVQEVRKLIGEGTVLWKNFMDVKGAISKKFRVSQLPYCYLVDANGQIVYRGGIGGPLFAANLSQLLPKK